ncbi:nucleotidyltransferase family protein [Pontibacter sp. JAM-7]|uniref:nucleotidyltransferase family protein n=1 Tax=Pontibacter sp. JAM-7 TaxID=3366581 RepID=UPI003AF62EAB
MKMAALILAAGKSARFDGCKLLADVKGLPLLQRTIMTAEAVCPGEVFVVTGAWHQQINHAQHAGQITEVPLLFNPQWSKGMGCSLALGVAELADDYEAILVMLADQVQLGSNDLLQLTDLFNGGNIVCSEYANQPGVPAIFPRPLFQQLMQLTGDQGAKNILTNSPLAVVRCPLPAAELDIDSREQLAQWLRQTERFSPLKVPTDESCRS